MKNLGVSKGKSKAQKRPFMMLFTSDYRDGTARLSFEQKGFYMQVLTLLHDGERVPADAKKLAVMMQCDPRTAARLAASLIAAGKLYEENGELRNKRIDRDFGATSAELQPDFAETSAELQPEVEEKSARTFQKPELNQGPQKHTNGITTSIPYSIPIPESTSSVAKDAAREAAAALPSASELSEKLIEACNGSLDNPVNCMGLLNVSTPLMWIRQGCDLDLDILPTLRAAGRKYHGKRIRDWSYFSGMVAEAKAKRQAGLPPVNADAPSKPSAYQLARAQILAEEARQ